MDDDASDTTATTNEQPRFCERPGFTKHHDNGARGDQWLFDFPNGYGASVIRGPHSYGGDHGRFELAVLKGGGLCYTTPITDDVLGHLSESEVALHLDAIAALLLAEGGAQ